MRETKFRGKSVKTGEWLSGYLFPRGLLNDPDYLSPLWIASGFENECMAVDEKTVGQCTGLCDKNGKEIYEGDIVSFSSFDHRGVVQFARGVYGINWDYVKNQDPEWKDGRLYGGWGHLHNLRHLADDILDDATVIGNIHENPELLK